MNSRFVEGCGIVRPVRARTKGDFDTANQVSASPIEPHWAILRRATAVVAFILAALVIYCGNLRLTATADTIPNSLVPFSLLLHHDIFVDRYLGQLNLAHSYFVRPFQGGYISVYPIGAAITALPLYAVFLAVGGHADFSTGMAVAKLAGALMAAISAVILYRTLIRLAIGKWVRIVFVLLYAFGTETFAISSQGLWQHGPAELWLCSFLYMAAKMYEGQSCRVADSAIAGFSIGMLLLTRPQDTVVILPFVVLLFSRKRRKYVLYAIPIVLAFVAIWQGYNHHFFGTLTHYGGVSGATGRLTSPLAQGLLGNLFNPSRGLFVFVPWSILALFWVVRFRSRKFWTGIYAPSLVALVLYVLMYAKLSYWAAGSCYGPRYMTDISPVLVLLAAGFLADRKQRRKAPAIPKKHNKTAPVVVARIVFGLFAVWSVAVQTLGVYVPGEDWNTAVLPDTFDNGLWSVKNGEIAYYARTLVASQKPLGPAFAPKATFSNLQLFAKPAVNSQPLKLSAFSPNERYAGTVRLTNDSNQTWSALPARHGQRLVVMEVTVWHNGHSLTSETTHGLLLYSVKPHQSITVNFYFWTPPTPGDYTYRFQIQQGLTGKAVTATPENSISRVVRVVK